MYTDFDQLSLLMFMLILISSYVCFYTKYYTFVKITVLNILSIIFFFLNTIFNLINAHIPINIHSPDLKIINRALGHLCAHIG